MHIATPLHPPFPLISDNEAYSNKSTQSLPLGLRFMGGIILLYGAKYYAGHEDKRFAKMGMRHRGVRMVGVGRKCRSRRVK